MLRNVVMFELVSDCFLLYGMILFHLHSLHSVKQQSGFEEWHGKVKARLWLQRSDMPQILYVLIAVCTLGITWNLQIRNRSGNVCAVIARGLR
jgi:hypothetical protein